MKFKVNIQQRSFEVEVGDVNQRPIVVTVEGDRLEVWPSAEVALPEPVNLTPPSAAPSLHRPPTSGPAPDTNASMVRAPIPGVIVSVAVQPGQAVTVGQELCVLEAMKMKNSIRAARAGTIAAVLVAVGQTVRQRENLIEYAA